MQFGVERPHYGQWTDRVVEMGFHPMPKRSAMRGDGSLIVREIEGGELSAPYDRVVGADAKELKAMEQILIEQPNFDLYSEEEEMSA